MKIADIDKKNSIYREKFYPYKRREISGGYRVVLGIGGNIGDVKRRFNHLFIYMNKSPFLKVIETSIVLKNPPFGYIEQSDFYNSLIFVKTHLPPKALLKYILRIEDRFGRRRSFKDAPRTLDIDMIFYEDLNIDSKILTLPHPFWRERASVITPMRFMKSLYVKRKLRG